MFLGLIGSSSTIDVISGGTGDSRNGLVQLVSGFLIFSYKFCHLEIQKTLMRFKLEHRCKLKFNWFRL